jgi:NADPH-dependent glutamate synthase beta subunit-like oxidoreductase/CO/xanthine dehydrogenase FAD-binding subunit
MKSFQHHDARSLKKATALLSKYNGKAKVNAGGTDLLGGLRDNCVADFPEAVINIKNIAGLNYIKAGARGLRIGALTTLAEIVKSPAIRKDYLLLAEAAHSVAGPNLRNMATIGGNLAQDVRCWYYRYPQQIGGPIVCLRKGGRICNALVGDNRYHSIFGAAAAKERRCAGHCPAHINIPAYLRQIRMGHTAAAARILLNYNPIPAITGRVCPVFCEPQCNRAEFDDPVAIHSVERGIGDYILAHAAEFFTPPESESGKKIAIVGSGPAGMAAAFYLRRSGHGVTVFEKMPEPGGMLLYSIPPYRLPKEVVRKQVQALKSMGIRFESGIRIGHERSAAQIQSDFDAVFLAGGTWKSLKLDVPGEDAGNVLSALDYLCRINSGERVSLGRKVLVIGGGSVAMDAARTARRLGSDEVHIVCLETRDLKSGDRMPALDQEIAEAEEEGILIHPSLGIREIIVENGKAVGIRTKRCSAVREPDGKFNPQYDQVSESECLWGESIVVAIGQVDDQSLAKPVVGQTGIFAGGDMMEGSSTVIQAVASAQKAADEIDTFLNGGRVPEKRHTNETDYAESCFENLPRVKVHAVPAENRVHNMDAEDVPDIGMSEVETEARRCVSCGCLAVGPSDLATALVALDAGIVTNKRTLEAGDFFSASATSSSILEPDELIKEIRVPKPPATARQSYRKFTLRKPLDFAVVSVASIITSRNGICSDARIMLGAVAPAPLRAGAAEASLKGKPITEAAAEEAANLALGNAVPLNMNAYKAEIAKVLIRRSILGLPD